MSTRPDSLGAPSMRGWGLVWNQDSAGGGDEEGGGHCRGRQALPRAYAS